MEALLLYFAPLIRYVASPIAGQSDAEDCLNETALRAWERIDSFDESRGSFRAWLTAIARNAALDMARKRRHTEEPPDEELRDDSPSAEEMLLDKEKKRALKAALEQLKGGEKALFYRKYYYMQSTAQIASELGMSERAVEGKLYRIKKKLAERLKNYR